MVAVGDDCRLHLYIDSDRSCDSIIAIILGSDGQPYQRTYAGVPISERAALEPTRAFDA